MASAGGIFVRMAGAVAITRTTVMAAAGSLITTVVVAMTMAMPVAMAMTVALAMRVLVLATRVNGRLRCRCWSVSILASDLNVSGGDGALGSDGGEARNGSPTGVFRVLAMPRWP